MAQSSAVQRDGEEAHTGAIASDRYVTTRGHRFHVGPACHVFRNPRSSLRSRRKRFCCVEPPSSCWTRSLPFHKCWLRHAQYVYAGVSRESVLLYLALQVFGRLHLYTEVEGEMGSACTMRASVRLCMPVHAIYHCPFLRRVLVSKRVLAWFKV